MSFEVVWLDEAAEELAELWFDRELRPGVTAAITKIDSVLASAPTAAGESRPDNRRILFESPVAVIFQVFMRERRVQVLRIWHYGRRSRP